MEEASHSQGTQLSELQELVSSLQHRADDAEDRQRRNNVQVVGLPEGAEGAKTIIFAEQFFKQLLSGDLPPTYVVERVHRVATGARPPGALLSPFLVRFLNSRDRDMILAESRKHEDLRFENACVMLFPEFSAETQKKYCSFTDVRKRLRAKEIQYNMLCSSRLQIQHKGVVKFIGNPLETFEWLTRDP